MNNSRNKLLTVCDVERILNYYGGIGDNGLSLCVKDLSIYQKAFVHESYYVGIRALLSNGVSDVRMTSLYIPDESNERLEFMGDNALKYIMARYIEERFPKEREGFMTVMKIKLEKTSMLHKFAKILKFEDFLLISEEVEVQTMLSPDLGRNTRSFYEDAFEAFIGSIVKDNGEMGIVYANRFVRKIMEELVDFSDLISRNDNFKDSLQRYYQSKKWRTPIYNSLSDDGPVYRRIFTRILWMKCTDDLDDLQRENLLKYTKHILTKYSSEKKIYAELYKRYISGEFLVGCGEGRRVVDSEQMCAKVGLRNLNLDECY